MLIVKCIDGFIKITIPELDMITYASDLEDIYVAIAEAFEVHRLTINQFAKVSKKNLVN